MSGADQNLPEAEAARTSRGKARPNRDRSRETARPGAVPLDPLDRFLNATVDELGVAALNLAEHEDQTWRRSRRAATVSFAQWLGQFPGENWHEKWLTSGVESLGAQWWTATGLDVHPAHRAVVTLMCLRVIRPSYEWLATVRLRGLQRFEEVNDLGAFGQIHAAAADRGLHAAAHGAAILSIVRIMAASGKAMADISKADFFSYVSAAQEARRYSSFHVPWELLRGIGCLVGEAPTLKAASALGPSSVEEVVDRKHLACREVRDVLVDYLKHRAPSLDYCSLWASCYYLAGLFWSDLEKHHPGISSLSLDPEVVDAWKRRMQSRMAEVSYLRLIVHVRAFYLDLAEWALSEPERWGAWAAPCPIQAHELKGQQKIARRATARLHARTRTLAPLLPVLAQSARAWMKETAALLAASLSVEVREDFVFNDRPYRRLGRLQRPGPKVLVQEQFGEHNKIDLSWAEEDAFWTWAVIEVLRLTGVRREELLELSHLCVRQYVRRDGQVTPLLQISPSKTDRERVIPMSSELVHVVATILRRVRGPDGTVPLVQRYDGYERVFSEPLPFLFQRSLGTRRVALGDCGIQRPLVRAAERAGITEVDGQPVRFTPHDFRRIFATEIVNSGLPVHIGSKLLGHLSLETTQRYIAIYPEEVIRHFEAYIARRRRERPSDEYREPTSEEWTEFEEHFALRKVALGDCGRPYGTPCIHEHACVRCPFLRVDPAQVHRLVQLEENTMARIREANEHGWLGEATGLNDTLIQITRKKEQVRQLHEDEQLSLV